MTANTDVHTCSYYCERPECIRRQRDELRDRMESVLASAPPSAPVGANVRKAGEVSPYSDVVLVADLAQQPAAPVLAKYQPCGCVICTCEDEQQCQGCGAKHCGNRADHPPYVAQQPAAVDETAREDATPPATSPVRILIDAIESEIRQLEGKADWKSQTARIASLRAALDAALAAQQQGGAE